MTKLIYQEEKLFGILTYRVRCTVFFSNDFSSFCRRPTGDPARDLLAYDMPALQIHKEKLLSDLKELQKENEIEKKKIIEVVDKMGETEKVIEGMLTKNERALEVLSSIQSL